MSNYKAIVAKIDKTIPIEKAERIHIAVVLGEYCIVSKDWQVGKVGLFFPAGTQLSEDFAKNNNLYRDWTKNVDTTKAGFFDDNRKVRCQKFLGVKSEGFFCELDSLAFTGAYYGSLSIGHALDEIGGQKICQKFWIRKERGDGKSKARTKRDAPFFLEHVETDQFKYNKHKIQKGDLISIQAKGHGTSGRSGILPVEAELPKWKQFINRFKEVFKPQYVYEHVVGTRRVFLDNAGKDPRSSEGFRHVIADKIKPFLSQGMTAYYEIVGYANDKPIMSPHSMSKLRDKAYLKKYGDTIIYKYGLQPGETDYYIYRLTYTTADGQTIDFSQAQLIEWCKKFDLPHCFEVVKPFVFDGDMEKLEALVELLTERSDLLTEDYRDPTIISEGVVIRVDNGNTTPLFLKNKSFVFKVLEGIAQEQEPDLEDNS